MTIDITSDITFRKLSIFMTFMEKGNIARTAETLGLSGVSVHRALHTLEENVRYSQTMETVPRLIMGMKLRRPDLEMDLTMGSNDTLLHLLDEGSLDAILISISESDIDRNTLEVLPLFHDDIFLAAPASAKLNSSGLADLRDYKDQKFVSLAEGFATYAGFQDAFQIAGFEPEIVTRVNDIFSMLSLVQAGVGFTLMPGRMKKVYENSVQLLKLAQPYQMQQLIAIVFARNREQDPSLRALAAEGRMYARSLQESA
ncbi:HTH-type transcriptional regulator GltC [compost metagenome]